MSRVDTDDRGNERYSEDDGHFDGGNVGDNYYKKTFEGRAGDDSVKPSRDNASKNLADAERGAASDRSSGDSASKKSSSAIESQRKKEELGSNGTPSTGFSNNVIGKKDDKKQKKGFFKKKGPLVAIILMMCGIGGGSYLSQATMPFSLISQFQGNFDSIGTSTNLRSRSFLKLQLDGSRVKSCTKSTIFGGTKFKVSSRQRAKLEKNGITFDSDGQTMQFTQSDGTVKSISAADFDAEYNGNPEFHDAYYSGSKTWRGAVADWFDSMATKFFEYIGVNRNNFSKFKKSNDADTDQSNFKNTVTEVADSDSLSGKAKGSSGVGDDTDDDGGIDSAHLEEGEDGLDIKRSDVPTDANGDFDSSSSANSNVESKVKSFASSKLAKAAGIASAITNFTCGVFNTLGAISMIVIAYQTIQILKTSSAIFEGIQKGQIDPSDGAPLNEIANSLTKATTTTYTDAETGESITRTRSALEANSVGALYGNIAVDTNDISVKNFNTMSVLDTLGTSLANSLNADASIAGLFSGTLELGVSSFQACTFAKLAANTVDLIMDGVNVAACIITAGIGCLVNMLLDSVSVTTLVGIGVAIIVPLVVPMIAQALTRRIATDVMGEDLGNALVSGANMYMGQNHQYSGGSVADKDSFMQYIAARDSVIADQAEYERRTRSPFDATSQYTFLGSIVTKLAPYAGQLSSITTGISGFISIVSSSFNSLSPTASAVTAATTAQAAADQTKENCPYLESIGAVGDAFCNPYFITDVNTIETDPADIVNKVEQLGGFENSDEEEVPTIKKDSDLAKYIVYCGQRQSQFGLPDQNIASSVQTASSGNTAVDIGIGIIPIVGDVVDLINNTEVVENYGYINGEACVTNNDKIAGTTYSDWDDNQYYQRFIEDQRLAENMGLVEESTVNSFLTEYYEEHPLDNSFEGMLARRSGLTKENVEIALADWEYLQFIAEYNPTGMMPSWTEEEEPENIDLADNSIWASSENMRMNVYYTSGYQEERLIKNFAVI